MTEKFLVSNKRKNRIFFSVHERLFCVTWSTQPLAVTQGTIVGTLRFGSFSWWVQLGGYRLLWLVFFVATVLHVFLTCGRLAR